MELDPPLPHYLTSDPLSFAHTSARYRWPAILTSAIDDMHRTISAIPSSASTTSKIEEGKYIVSQLSSLKYEVQHNRALVPLEDDGGGDVGIYNDELRARGEGAEEEVVVRWHDVEWLYAECYLYRRVSSLYKRKAEWRDHDCFARQKLDTFRSSRPAVGELAARYREIVMKIREEGTVVKEGKVVGEKEREEAEMVLWREIAEVCLWGNATDLSLLTSLSYEDIQRLQGRDVERERESKVLVNDLERAFGVLNGLKKEGRERRRVDVVLDNAGFELFVDLILAGYLIETGLATEVVLHPKDIPWFVSDVVPKDLGELLRVMGDPKAFYEGEGGAKVTEMEEENAQFLFEHWSRMHQEGQLILRPNRFWTHPGSFWRMPKTAEGLLEDLKESELVVFKGDLNYRKLCGDAAWDPTTPFEQAIGPLGKTSGIRTLALRTCKADVVVGLPQGKDEEIRATEGGGGDSGARKWAWSGKWAVVQFCDGK